MRERMATRRDYAPCGSTNRVGDGRKWGPGTQPSRTLITFHQPSTKQAGYTSQQCMTQLVPMPHYIATTVTGHAGVLSAVATTGQSCATATAGFAPTAVTILQVGAERHTHCSDALRQIQCSLRENQANTRELACSRFLHDHHLFLAVELRIPLGARELTMHCCAGTVPLSGFHCERCSVGFYNKNKTGAAADWRSASLECVPCCFNHSPLCDAMSGVCSHCEHNTTGDFCEVCVPGRFGDATAGTPDDCAQECDCNGHSSVPCDTSNGVCFACEHNTTGDFCEYCETDFYGLWRCSRVDRWSI